VHFSILPQTKTLKLNRKYWKEVTPIWRQTAYIPLLDKDIYIPQRYVEIIENAGEVNQYKVKYVDHSFFKDFSQLKYYTTIRPGNRVGTPVVTDIRNLKYTAEGTIMYKLNYSDKEYTELRKPRNFKSRKYLIVTAVHCQ
jgi:hypothetical protein